MKILFFVSSLNAGGAERVATTLANAWARRGDDVVLVPTYLTRHTSFYPVDDDVTLTWLADSPGHALSRFVPGLGKWLQIRRLIKATRPDVVISFLTNVNVNVLIASMGLNVPVIVSERTNPVYSQNTGKLLQFLRRVTYPRARFVIMQTQASVEPFKALVPGVSDVLVVPNPLPPAMSAVAPSHDSSASSDSPPSHDMLAQPSAQPVNIPNRQIVAMGRLVATKQFDVLIKAFGQLAPEHPDWRLTLWGEGPLRSTLEQKIADMGLNGRVTLAGRTSDPWQALSQADIFAMTSRVEGFPNVLMEAMALGLPCVALDCPSGPAELTRDGQDARLLPLNDPQALTGALQELMTDTTLRQSLGHRASKSVMQRYGLDTILTQWDHVFKCALTRRTLEADALHKGTEHRRSTMHPPHALPTLRIVHIISGLGQGGAETVLHRLVTAADQDTEHIVISMGGQGIFGPRLHAAGITVYALGMRDPLLAAKGMWRLYKLLRDLDPDVVQTWMYHADLFGGLIARLAGIRAVSWGIRNSGADLAKSSRSSRTLAAVCAPLSRLIPGVVVACAENAAQRHQRWGYDADRMLVVPNGYDLSLWQPDVQVRAQVRAEWGLDDGVRVVGSVARWNPLKDHENLIAALSRLKHDGQVRVVLIGQGMGAENSELMALLRQYGMTERVILLGSRDDVPRLMQGLDIHVLSSRAEGFPNVVAEAMAAGVLCVVTDVGDAAHIVADTGWMVPARDATALARGIDQALHACGTPDAVERIIAGRQRVEGLFSLETMVLNWHAVWRRLASDFPRRSQRTRQPVNPGVMYANSRSDASFSDSVNASYAPEPSFAGAAGPAPAMQGGADRAARRLLFVVTNPAFFLSHRLPVALAAQRAGFDVHVATMDGPSVPVVQGHGFVHHIIPLWRSGKNPVQELRSIWVLWRVCRHVRPDIMHAVTIKSVLYGGIAARLARVPAYVAAISGLGYVFTRQQRGFNYLRLAATVLYRLALGHPNSRVIFQNTADREMLEAARVVRPGQSVLIRGSGVDLNEFRYVPEPAEPIVVLCVARLLKDKGIYEFVEAARLSQRRGDALRWVLVGSPDPGYPASVSEAEIRAWHDEGVIEWLGERTDIAELNQQAHIAVLPSYREGLPKSLIEAAASGRAIVTTDVPGCRDAIEPDVTGVLVPPRDATALADAVRELAIDGSRRMDMGRAGRDLAEKEFDIDNIARKQLDVYESLLQTRRE